METEMTPGQRRTLGARTTRTERKYERWGDEMRTAGWVAIKPEIRRTLAAVTDAGDARVLLDRILSGELG